jgi:beta-glucosidase
VSELPAGPVAFPDGFVWGTAAAAHQVEGGNWNNDWWAWEHDPSSPCVEPSGDACDHYHRYDSDFALLASFGHSAHRFGLEWARIEPEPGEFSNAALDHYSRVLDSLDGHGLTAFPTLHHFTSPRWFAAEGGWASEGAIDRFRRYADVVARRLGPRLHFVCTINEPQIVALYGYQFNVFPPGASDASLFGPATRNFVGAHAAAVEAFGEHASGAEVGLVLSITDFQAVDAESQHRRDRIHHRMAGVYIDALRDGVVSGVGADAEFAVLRGARGFVGVNYYSRARISAGEPTVLPPPEGAETTQMAYEVVPDSFVTVLHDAARAGLPIYVTENGIGTDDDRQRIRFIARHLAAVRRAMDEGVDVRGYLYWSAMDNFEWVLGYTKTFGLIGFDRETFDRRPKPSAHYFGEIARANAVEPAVTTRYLD